MSEFAPPPSPLPEGAVPYYRGAPYRVVMVNHAAKDLGTGLMISGAILVRDHADQLLFILDSSKQDGWTVHMELTEIYGDNVFGTSKWAKVDDETQREKDE